MEESYITITLCRPRPKFLPLALRYHTIRYNIMSISRQYLGISKPHCSEQRRADRAGVNGMVASVATVELMFTTATDADGMRVRTAVDCSVSVASVLTSDASILSLVFHHPSLFHSRRPIYKISYDLS